MRRSVRRTGDSHPLRQCPPRGLRSFRVELPGSPYWTVVDEAYEPIVVADRFLSARRDARPAEKEIAAVQRLVRRREAKLAELPESERDAVEEAIVVLRRARAQRTGRATPSGQPLAIRQIKPTLNLRVAADGVSR